MDPLATSVLANMSEFELNMLVNDSWRVCVASAVARGREEAGAAAAAAAEAGVKLRLGGDLGPVPACRCENASVAGKAGSKELNEESRASCACTDEGSLKPRGIVACCC